MPPELTLSPPFIWLLMTCLVSIVLACYYYRKARLYNKKLRNLREMYHNLDKNAITPTNSKGGTITAHNQLTGNHS